MHLGEVRLAASGQDLRNLRGHMEFGLCLFLLLLIFRQVAEVPHLVHMKMSGIGEVDQARFGPERFFLAAAFAADPFADFPNRNELFYRLQKLKDLMFIRCH